MQEPSQGVRGKHFHMVAVPTTVKHHHHGKARNFYKALISPEGILPVRTASAAAARTAARSAVDL